MRSHSAEMTADIKAKPASAKSPVKSGARKDTINILDTSRSGDSPSSAGNHHVLRESSLALS
jgi:hypothetical protein